MSDIDLTDLLERITGCINNAEYDDEQETLTDAFAVIEAQAAEIEKLEANINSKAHFIEAIMGHMDLQFAAGAAEERAKIVAWLRDRDGFNDYYSELKDQWLSDRIARGEHLK